MDKIFIFLISPLNADVPQVSWCLWRHNAASGKAVTSAPIQTIQGAGTIEEFANLYHQNYADKELVAVISGEYVTYMDVALTVKNQKQMLQALPFLVEEQIVGNIEDMHIAIPEKLDGDTVRIAVIEKGVLDAIKSFFTKFQLPVTTILGLPDLLVSKHDGLQILLNDDFAIVKGRTCCFQCDQANLETILELIPLDDLSTITVSLNELNKFSLSLAKKIKNKFGSDLLKVQSSIFTEEILSYIIKATNADIRDSLNILQGDASAASRNKKIHQFLPLAWVAILCLFLQISFNIASGLYFKRLSGHTYQNASALYLQLFPDEKKVVNLAAQITAKANSSAVDAHSSRFPVVFSSTINAMHQVANQPEITLKQFRYDEAAGELKIGVDTTSIALLDKFKNKLSESSFIVEINSANEEKGIIKATLSIKSV